MGIVLPPAVADNDFVSAIAVPTQEHRTMSSSNHNTNGANGLITLKSFSELASVLDLESLPPGPADSDSTTEASTSSTVEASAVDRAVSAVDEPITATQQLDLASVIAQLASVSSGLESMAREDARPR